MTSAPDGFFVHSPVLLQECLQYLSPLGEPYGERPLMVDATLGEGGHAEAFLTRFPYLRIAGVDKDGEIQARARRRLRPFAARMTFYSAWFDDFFANVTEAPDLILFDLGISLFHYRASGRGFSFSDTDSLDMRLGGDGETASDLVNTLGEKALADLIFQYSEERYSRRIARGIVEGRRGGGVQSAKELAEIVWGAVPEDYRHRGIHPATKTFQALRIVVNRELERLSRALEGAFAALSVRGKLGVITFHSLEDRLVKNVFRDLAKHCICPPEVPICTCSGLPRAELLSKKAVRPTEDECRANPPSRSAKLRVVRKLRDV